MDVPSQLYWKGEVMIICGIVYLTVNLLLNYLIELSELSASKIEGLNLIILMITSYAILVIIPFYSTETHMNKTFDKNGNRKQKN